MKFSKSSYIYTEDFGYGGYIRLHLLERDVAQVRIIHGNEFFRI